MWNTENFRPRLDWVWAKLRSYRVTRGYLPSNVNYLKITCNFHAKKNIFFSFYCPDCSKMFALESKAKSIITTQCVVQIETRLIVTYQSLKCLHGFRKFSKAPFWNVPLGWYMGAGDVKKSSPFGSRPDGGWHYWKATRSRVTFLEGDPTAGQVTIWVL